MNLEDLSQLADEQANFALESSRCDNTMQDDEEVHDIEMKDMTSADQTPLPPDGGRTPTPPPLAATGSGTYRIEDGTSLIRSETPDHDFDADTLPGKRIGRGAVSTSPDNEGGESVAASMSHSVVKIKAEVSKAVPNDADDSLVTNSSMSRELQDSMARESTPADSKAAAKTSIPQAMFHVFKANVGGGIFLLPTFYNESGWLVGVILFLLVGVIAVDCIMMLLKVKNKIGRSDAQSYPSLARFVFGKQMKSFVTTALVITQFGFCMMYLQYCASLFDQVFDFPYAYQFFVLFGFVLVTPLTFMTHKLHLLAVASMFATGCVLFVIVSSFIASVTTLASDGVAKTNMARPPLQWVLFLASSITVLEGIGVILPVENSVKEKEKYPAAVKRTMITIVGSYLVYGLAGQLAFGTALKASLVQAMKPGIVTTMARVALGMSLWLSYPLQYVPAIQIVDRALRLHTRTDAVWKGRVLRIALNGAFAGVALVVGADALALFFAFIGSIAASALCITLPALLTLQVDRALNGDLRSMPRPLYYLKVFSGPYTRRRVKCQLYVVLGMTIMIVGTIVSIHDVIYLKKTEKHTVVPSTAPRAWIPNVTDVPRSSYGASSSSYDASSSSYADSLSSFSDSLASFSDSSALFPGQMSEATSGGG